MSPLDLALVILLAFALAAIGWLLALLFEVRAREETERCAAAFWRTSSDEWRDLFLIRRLLPATPAPEYDVLRAEYVAAGKAIA